MFTATLSRYLRHIASVSPSRMNQFLGSLFEHKIPLVSQSDGSLVELRQRGDSFSLTVERQIEGRVRHVSLALSTEQGDTLKKFAGQVPEGATSDIATVEIERKWCPREATHLEDLSRQGQYLVSISETEQGYLCIGGGEARVRRKNDSYFLTVKSSGDLTRREVEVALTPEQWRDLWPLTVGQRIEKDRVVMDVAQPNGGSARVEVDRFKGHLAPLVLVECEFSSAESAAAFVAPACFGEEVTLDPRFKNKALAKGGSAEIQLSDGRLPKAV